MSLWAVSVETFPPQNEKERNKAWLVMNLWAVETRGDETKIDLCIVTESHTVHRLIESTDEYSMP